MAQKDLKPVRTKEEAKERGRNGGINSGKARRKQKQVKELLKSLLATKANPEHIEEIKKIFPDIDVKTIEDTLNIAIIKEGVGGNVQAYNAVYDRIEGKPQQKTELTGEDGKGIVLNINVQNKEDQEAIDSLLE